MVADDQPDGARNGAEAATGRSTPAVAGFRGVTPVDLETLRLFLHVLAATVWVGGQITLAALIPALRAAGTEVPKAAARAFNRVAWPAFGILVLTGIWNVVAEGDKGPAYQHTLTLKYTLVVGSGITAFFHARATSRKAMAVFGALTGLTALAALFVGIMLAE
jgi:putative copper export protein